MKRIVLTLIISTLGFAVTVAQSNTKTSNKQTTTKTTESKAKTKEQAETGKIELLTVASFKQKVMNYDNGQYDWNYIGSKPCIIDFYADWCRPCRMLSPELEKIAERFKSEIIVYKIDTEKEKELAHLFGISSIPALLFVPANNGKPTMLRGYRTAAQLEEEVKSILLAK